MTQIRDGEYLILETAKPCLLHKEHIPSCHVNEIHHIWPKGYGGPDIPANTVIICATGHNNVHALIRMFQVYSGDVPYMELRSYSFEERNLARLGYDRITRQAM